MTLEEPSASIHLAPYTGCPHCAWAGEIFPLPLSSEAAPEKEPDGFDWNKYYWGTDWAEEQPAERKTIRRPLPHSITDRIPLEVCEHIIHFLAGYQGSLYSCALVHPAWYHLSQKLLYPRVKISQQSHFDAVVRNQCSSSSTTQALSLYLLNASTTSFNHGIKTLPMVASKRWVHQLQCLSICSFQVPYNGNFTKFMSRFSQLSHLKLWSFTLYSFGDLRRIICALPGLLDLTLFHGDAASGSPNHHEGPVFTPRNSPRLRKISLERMKSRIMAPFSQWLASTDVCSTCTELEILIGDHLSEDWATYISPILEHIGCTLQSLSYNHDGDFSNIDHITAPLARCTRLSILVLRIPFLNSNTWQDLVTILHNIVLHISSHRLQKLRLTFKFMPSNNIPHELPPKDSVLGDIALEPIHNTIKSSYFNSLLDATVRVDTFSLKSGDDKHITRDVALTDDELANQLRLLLQPWDKRGIVKITDYLGRPLRADPVESDRIKDITPEDIQFNTRGAEGGDETSHIEHVGYTGHAEEDEARKGQGE